MKNINDSLKEILIRDELISSPNLEKALDEHLKSGHDLARVLSELDLLEESFLIQSQSEALSIPFVKISRMKLDKDVLDTITVENAVKYNVMPVALLGDQLTLAMAEPLDIVAIDSIKFLTGCMVRPVLAGRKDISKGIDFFYLGHTQEEIGEELDEIIQNIKNSDEVEIVKVDKKSGRNDVEVLKDEAPIIKLTDTIIKQAVASKASDVFIEPLEKEVRIRYRVDGVIREIDRMSKSFAFPIVSRIKIISHLDISEHRLPQDGRFKIILGTNKTVDFRVSVLPTVFGEKVVLRVLDKDGVALDIDKLGFFPSSLQRLKETIIKPHGLILTCGPTGSGKTTTLYSILKYVDSPEKNIVTVEDPVEYQIKGLNQVNIKQNLGLTFATSLRSILRQDPDVIMIGEIRDSDTLNIAVKAALTGHLVLSSLHTTTAAGSIVRMLNMGLEPFLICSSVLAIVAQRLIRRLCDRCKESYDVELEFAKKIGLADLYDKEKITMFRPVGCSNCFRTGYKGRVGITEILIFSHEISEMVLAREGEIEIKKMAVKNGMKTMRQDAFIKAIDGLTSIEEVLRITASDES